MDKITNRRRWSSLPVRGAWIEIIARFLMFTNVSRRSPCGERGLKYQSARHKVIALLVAPRAGSVD